MQDFDSACRSCLHAYMLAGITHAMALPLCGLTEHAVEDSSTALN